MRTISIFINSLSCGGAERTAVWLANALVAHGCRVSIVTLYDNKDDFLTLGPRVTRLSLEMSRENTCGLIENVIVCRSLRKIFKQVNPDVVLALQTGGGVVGLLSSIGLPHRVIVAERNYPGRKKVSFLLGVLRKALYRFADCVVAQTNITKEWIEDHCGCDTVSVIPNAVHWPVANVQPVLEPDTVLAPGDRLVLAVGRLHAQKGFDLLVEAFSGCAAKCAGWKLVILGDNGRGGAEARQRDRLEQLVRDKGLEGHVLLPGRAGNIGQWYKRADLFVLSSRYEGFPNVLLEAMASGCPSVAFDCNTGPREIIEHDKSGLLVPAESVSALTQALERMMHDEALRHRLGKEAVGVVDAFSVQRVMTQWEEVLCSNA